MGRKSSCHEDVLVTKAIAAASDPTVTDALTKIERLFEELTALVLDFESQNVSNIQELEGIKNGKIREKLT